MLRRILLLLSVCLIAVGIILYRNMGPTLACSLRATSKFRTGLSLHTIISGGFTRCYWLVVPETSSESDAMALVFSLHGFASNPRGQRSYSQWDEVASRHGAAVVYPQGGDFPLQWNSFSGAPSDALDDVAFFRDMLAELEAALPIDPGQVYVTGFSNGAAMTLRLLCEAGDLITAAGTIAAPVTPSINSCELRNPVPLIAFQGSDDPVVDINGWDEPPSPSDRTSMPVRQGKLLGFSSWTEAWARKSGCNAPPEIILNTEEVRALRYSGCADKMRMEVYTIFGGGHTWPGGNPIPLVGPTSQAISASETMWDFFAAQIP